MIASLAAKQSVHTGRIEIWRCGAKEQPTPYNLHPYIVLENLTWRLNVPMFAERAGTHDSPTLWSHLRDHVFIVKERPDQGRWQAKVRARERTVFMAI